VTEDLGQASGLEQEIAILKEALQKLKALSKNSNENEKLQTQAPK
jgi:hypothetical protein